MPPQAHNPLEEHFGEETLGGLLRNDTAPPQPLRECEGFTEASTW
eukprot:CAMPEP_0204564640 /NCGR_PEP_ID=MMETSP0661-20131031/35009_1 /ASSEMBLY_ACC=CAM_ASM_000606 /TAXON_ID=109239 /ORGANISM="Alexandrium margalefi, Strain AMGDE01CS-322" /LENGTH=44 /DNA_ID= /DNA_START= /DNA_END= /DNA_ORIENTATION=